jgi:hypothetical protein
MPLMTTRKKLWLRMVENKTLIAWILQEYIIAFVGVSWNSNPNGVYGGT